VTPSSRLRGRPVFSFFSRLHGPSRAVQVLPVLWDLRDFIVFEDPGRDAGLFPPFCPNGTLARVPHPCKTRNAVRLPPPLSLEGQGLGFGRFFSFTSTWIRQCRPGTTSRPVVVLLRGPSPVPPLASFFSYPASRGSGFPSKLASRPGPCPPAPFSTRRRTAGESFRLTHPFPPPLYHGSFWVSYAMYTAPSRLVRFRGRRLLRWACWTAPRAPSSFFSLLFIQTNQAFGLGGLLFLRRLEGLSARGYRRF